MRAKLGAEDCLVVNLSIESKENPFKAQTL